MQHLMRQATHAQSIYTPRNNNKAPSYKSRFSNSSEVHASSFQHFKTVISDNSSLMSTLPSFPHAVFHLRNFRLQGAATWPRPALRIPHLIEAMTSHRDHLIIPECTLLKPDTVHWVTRVRSLFLSPRCQPSISSTVSALLTPELGGFNELLTSLRNIDRFCVNLGGRRRKRSALIRKA